MYTDKSAVRAESKAFKIINSLTITILFNRNSICPKLAILKFSRTHLNYEFVVWSNFKKLDVVEEQKM